MVVRGNIVTRNKNTFQRRVAASLAVLPRSQSPCLAKRLSGHYVPQMDLSAVVDDKQVSESCLLQVPVADPVANIIEKQLLKNEPLLPETSVNPESTSSRGVSGVVFAPGTESSGRPVGKTTQVLSKIAPRPLRNAFNKAPGFGWLKGWLGK